MEQRTRGQRGGRKAVLAVLVALAALLAILALGLVVTQDAGARGATSAEKLAELRVRPEGSMVDYSRDKFPHWSDAQEYG